MKKNVREHKDDKTKFTFEPAVFKYLSSLGVIWEEKSFTQEECLDLINKEIETASYLERERMKNNWFMIIQ